MVLPSSMQSSLPAGWLAFTGRVSNPLDREERFQIPFSSSFPGLFLTRRRSAPARSWQQSESRDHEWSECRVVARLPHSASGSSPAAPDRHDTSLRLVPRAGLQATSPSPLLRSPRRLFRPLPALPHWRGPARRHGAECLPGKSCRRAGRSGTQGPPSPYDTAFSEGSGSLSVLLGSSPIIVTSPSSKAHQKSGSFAPLALPSFNAPTTLSDSRQSRRLSRR